MNYGNANESNYERLISIRSINYRQPQSLNFLRSVTIIFSLSRAIQLGRLKTSCCIDVCITEELLYIVNGSDIDNCQYLLNRNSSKKTLKFS